MTLVQSEVNPQSEKSLKLSKTAKHKNDVIRIFQGKNIANQKICMANLHSYFFHQLRKRTTLCDKSAGTDASSHTLLEQDHANEQTC